MTSLAVPPPVRRRDRLAARVLGAAALLAMLLLGVWALFLGAMAEGQAASEHERRASETAAATEEVESLSVDLEAGVRGYLLGRESRFLERTRAAGTALPSALGRLERLVAQDSRQRMLVAELHRSIDGLAAYHRDLLARALRGRVSPRDAASAGQRRLDRIHDVSEAVLSRHRLVAGRERARARASARRAALVGSGVLIGAVALFVAVALALTRSVAAPVRRVSQAARRLAGGDLSARVPPTGRGELRTLGQAFNSMSASLEEGQGKLNDYGVELQAQQHQLERSNRELAHEKERVERLRLFGERLARETGVASLGQLVLEGMCTAAGADAGALYVLDAGESTLRLTSTLGADAERLSPTLSPSAGLIGLAVGEGRPIAASYATAAPSAFGEATGGSRELYVPLLPARRAVGVVMLARMAEADFSDEERGAVEHLADQAAVALSNALSFQDASHQATINRAVLDATPDAVGLFDTRGGTLLENASMSRVRSEMHARGAVATPRGPGSLPTMDPAAYEAALEAAGADPDRTARDEAMLGDRHLERYTAPVSGEGGEPIGRIVVLRDVTAEREAERLKEEFFALVSHELRTPLTSILGYVDLVLEEDQETPLDPHVRRSLEVVDRNARRLLRLVGDLLFAAQFEAGTLALESGTIRLDALAAESVQAAGPRAEAKGVVLELDAQALPACVGDRDRLAQTFDNLISNAVKFTPPGRARERPGPRTRRSSARGGRGHGRRHPAAEQGRLFERFFRASTATDGAIPGVGLGLTIVKAIVEGHGGRIAVQSEAGTGTRFRILLPLRRRSRAPTSRRWRDERPEEKPLVLVAEDDGDILALVAYRLERAGYDVITATNGEDAANLAAAERPDLAVLDVMMPRLDGYAVTRRIRADGAPPRCP